MIAGWVFREQCYDETDDAVVTRGEALGEVARHNETGGVAAFLAEVGDRPGFVGGEASAWVAR